VAVEDLAVEDLAMKDRKARVAMASLSHSKYCRMFQFCVSKRLGLWQTVTWRDPDGAIPALPLAWSITRAPTWRCGTARTNHWSQSWKSGRMQLLTRGRSICGCIQRNSHACETLWPLSRHYGRHRTSKL
jgi:hypothetical protein